MPSFSPDTSGGGLLRRHAEPFPRTDQTRRAYKREAGRGYHQSSHEYPCRVGARLARLPIEHDEGRRLGPPPYAAFSRRHVLAAIYPHLGRIDFRL
jgi:hypothetical protein